MRCPCPPTRRLAAAVAAAMAAAAHGPVTARADDVSPPAILQDFESTWQAITNKMPDVFAAGYGSVYTPPPGRAQSGNQSVGYDVYDRFDFGSAGNPTLYGTAAGLKQMVQSVHAMGGNSYVDLVWNHDGFADTGTTGFAAAGGYPGFALTLQTNSGASPGYNTRGLNVADGDFHSAYASGDTDGRLAGLVDIDPSTNNVFIRQPTAAGNPLNIPGPTAGAAGFASLGLANVPKASNAQFYPDQTTAGQTLYSSTVGGTFTRYHFGATGGTPVAENALGYLQRYAQYMVQVVGADGFRVDAAKNMPSWVMNYLDVATFDASNRYQLNGARQQVFSYGEVYDGSASLLQSYIDKTGASTAGTTVGGNRDVYDFPLFFAMQSNLSGTTANNSWYNVVGTSIDANDDGKLNGSQGVKFVQTQDNGAPALANVAHAYVLMQPGNAQVYFNGHNFGTASQRSFPQDGRGDALGGTYGSSLTTLVDLRNRFGRGNYRQDYVSTNELAFERTGSALVLLSNRSDAGFDSRTVPVTFAAGTPLLEYTGNAHGAGADPNGDIPQLLVVNADSSSPTGASVNVRFLRSSTTVNGASTYTGNGYLVYGLPTPTGKLSVTNVAGTFGNASPSSTDANVAYLNGTTLNSTVDVIRSATFAVQLNTNVSNLLGSYRDHDSDGDNAVLKVDGGVDVSGSGLVTDPASVAYGFGQFVTVHAPGYSANNGAGGDGAYAQTISTARLGQGYHYLTVEAFRHRSDNGPAVYTDWRQTVYVDLAPPNSAAVGFAPTVAGTNENRTLAVTSVDGLANNVHTFLDLPFGLTDAQVIAMVGTATQATQADVASWTHGYTGVTSGNHTATVVSYKPDGTVNVQRFASATSPFLAVSTYNGLGVGDLNFDGTVTSADVNAFTTVLLSGNTTFNPAADVTGDGTVDLADTFLLGPVLSGRGANAAAFTAYNNLTGGSYVRTHGYAVNGTHVIYDDTAAATNVSGGSSLTAAWVRGGSLTVAAGGAVRLGVTTAAAYPGGTSSVTGLTVAGVAGAWTGQVDLGTSGLVIASTAATRSADLARFTDMAAQGFDAGRWDGSGLATAAASGDRLHGLGLILDDDGTGHVLTATFGGQSATVNSVLAAYALYGDTNLDGVVNAADYTRLDVGAVLHQTGWAAGDFNYDGVVDGSDYALADNAFNRQAAVAVAAVARPTSAVAAVPEPTTCLAAAVAAGLTLTPRRRPR